MEKKIPIFLPAAVLMLLCAITVAAAEDAEDDDNAAADATEVNTEHLDSLVPKDDKPPPGLKPDVKPADDKKPVQVVNLPDDSRKLRVTIKMKGGKTYTGTVKHFLLSDRLVDHSMLPPFNPSNGPTVQYETSEFAVSWEEVKRIEVDKNAENGELSCVDNYDASPKRKECLMLNQYALYTKKKGLKTKHTITDKNLFRFVVNTGADVVNLDGHFSKMVVNNSRDEEAVQQNDLIKDLKKTYAEQIQSIDFY